MQIPAIPIRMPRPQPFTSSLGVHLASENAVVEIHTDEGIIPNRDKLEKYRIDR